jgi:hypothetical protein
VQEVIVARETIIYYDLESISLQEVSRPVLGMPMVMLLTQRDRWVTRRSTEFEFSLDLIELFAEQECSDPRDMVYGMLSLVEIFDPGHSCKASPNYNKRAPKKSTSTCSTPLNHRCVSPQKRLGNGSR